MRPLAELAGFAGFFLLLWIGGCRVIDILTAKKKVFDENDGGQT